MIDAVREYWDARPCNIRHSKLQVGTREYFDEVETRKYFVEPHIEAFAEFDKWRGKKVLEIGCGIGTDALRFARAGANYTGIDISPKSIDLARKRFRLYGLRGSFFVHNAETPPLLRYESYDLIYAFGVIHHSPQPEKVVSSAKWYMDERSQFRLMLYAKHSWKNIMILAGLDQPEAQAGCPVAHTYTEEEARHLLKDFEILDLHQDHIFTYDVDKYVQYEYEELPWFREMPAKVFSALRRALGWHMLIKCKLPTP